MNKIKFILFFYIAAFISCSKEDPVILKISDAQYRVERINDNECVDVNNGSSIRITLKVENADIVVEKLVNQYVDQSGSGGQLEFEVQADELENGKLNYEWCYFFGDNDWFEEKYKLIGMTMRGEPIESNEFVLKIERPDGAN